MSEVSMCTIRGVRRSTPIDPGMHTLTPYFVLHILDTAADREVVRYPGAVDVFCCIASWVMLK